MAMSTGEKVRAQLESMELDADLPVRKPPTTGDSAAAAAIGGAIWLALPTATQEAGGQHLPQLRVTPHAAGLSGQATWSF